MTLPVGTRASRIGDDVVLEISQIGKVCHTKCAIYYQAGDCVMPREGIFAVVRDAGRRRRRRHASRSSRSATARATARPRTRSRSPRRSARRTCARRCAAGRRGVDAWRRCASASHLLRHALRRPRTPPARALIELVRGARLGGRRPTDVCPDDRECIAARSSRMADVEDADVVLTCGGTGLGPRDVTPEATLAVADREAPGIAEDIRAESLQGHRSARCSRARVAALRGTTLVINLPGSEKAARESFGFVADQLEHAVEMMAGGGH